MKLMRGSGCVIALNVDCLHARDAVSVFGQAFGGVVDVDETFLHLERSTMPNVSNVQLQIQHTTAQQAPTASRNVAVNYQIGFTQPEVDARAAFQVKVSIVANDNTVLPLTSFNVTAAPGTVSRADTTTFKRQQLDDDPDFEIVVDAQGHPHRIPSEMPDSWRARVLVNYVPETVFGNATGMSGSVTGSWGALGND